MRTVEVFEREYNPRGKGALKLIGHGNFHEWGVDFEEFETGPGNYTVAIVEMEDGSVLKVDPELIRFVEPNKSPPSDAESRCGRDLA